jgi:7,8-dihydropterin-6-yl-methyl-4-(beta-D-ribofuranosyl)aminobenzene 5'-phosphate synthase
MGAKDLRLTIIYDNTAFDNRLTPEWGFAVLVEFGDHTVLFDTGGSSTFMDNMHLLGIDPKIVGAVVLSHEHGDHTGGLHSFLSEADQPVVYLLEGFSRSFKRVVSARTEVVEVSSSMEIFPGIFTTGQIYGGGVYEQGLAIDLGNEIVVITGCAHPGVVRMTRRGRSAVQPGTNVEYKPIALVIGGFHLMGSSRNQVEAIIEDLRELGVKQVSPTHCTGDDVIEIFAQILGGDYIMGGAGRIITISAEE